MSKPIWAKTWLCTLMVIGGSYGSFAVAAEPGAPAASKSLSTPPARRALDKGLAYLAAKQNDDGSFGTGGYARNVAVCGLCGMAFLAEGSRPGRGTYGRTVNRTV